MKKKSMSDLHRVSCDEFKKAPKMPLVVILDDVRSLNNIGSIFRTADGVAVESLYLCCIAGCVARVEMQKTALGLGESVVWR